MRESHNKESEALQVSMDQERNKQESRLKDRLAKKKQEKENEFQKKALDEVRSGPIFH